MANSNSPRGATPVRMLDGTPYNGAVQPYLVPSADGTALFIGDFVKAGGTAGAAGVTVNGIDCEGLPTVIQAAAGDVLLYGVVVGFLPLQTDLSVKHRLASTNRIAFVATNPNIVYEIQEDSLGAATAAVDVGENADIVVSAGSTTTGLSGMQLDSSDHKTGTAQLRILGFVKRPDNAIGTNAKLEVLINEHAFKSTTGT